MTYRIELTNVDWDSDGNAETIEYEFPVLQNIEEIKEKNFLGVGAPQSENSVQFGLTPPKKRVPLEFLIVDRGNDTSNGTLSSSGISDSDFSNGTVETYKEQIKWLQHYINTGTLGAQWRLYGGQFSDPDGDGTDQGTPVALAQVRINEAVDRINAAKGFMTLQVGDVV